MKDYPYMVGLMIFGIVVILLSSFYYSTNYKQDSIVQGLTETIRTTAISNIDYSSRVEPGEVYLIEDNFESELKEKVKKNFNVKISEDAIFQFDYLKDTAGSLKAIRVIVTNEETAYQATAKVNLAESA